MSAKCRDRDDDDDDSTSSWCNDDEPTEQELKWATAIRDAAVAHPDIHDTILSDLEYLQHAVIAKDQVDKALARMERMQRFKERYGILGDGSLEEGLRDLKAFTAAHPGVILAVEQASSSSAAHVTACCCAKFFARDIRVQQGSKGKPESLAITMRGVYYVLQACHGSLPAMRAGMISIMDNQHCGWRNFNLRVEECVGSLFAQVYPARVNQVVMLGASWTTRLLYRLLSVLFPKKLRQRHVFFADCEAYLASSSFTKVDHQALPVKWGGLVDAAALEDSLRQKLQARYDLAAKFKL